MKNLGRDDFKYLTQEFDGKLLHLVKQKEFYPYENIKDIGKFKQKLSSKDKFYNSFMGKITSAKKYDFVLKAWDRYEIKTMKDHHDLYLKCDVLFLAYVCEKFRSSCFKKLEIMCKSLFECTSFNLEMQCLIRQKLNLTIFQMQTCIYSFRKM